MNNREIKIFLTNSDSLMNFLQNDIELLGLLASFKNGRAEAPRTTTSFHSAKLCYLVGSGLMKSTILLSDSKKARQTIKERKAEPSEGITIIL